MHIPWVTMQVFSKLIVQTLPWSQSHIMISMRLSRIHSRSQKHKKKTLHFDPFSLEFPWLYICMEEENGMNLES